MRQYLVRVRNGGCRQDELTELFNDLSSKGWIFDKICSSGSDGIFNQRVYIIFYLDN